MFHPRKVVNKLCLNESGFRMHVPFCMKPLTFEGAEKNGWVLHTPGPVTDAYARGVNLPKSPVGLPYC